MKRWLLTAAALFLGAAAFSWGFWAHRKINHTAVFTLPPEMIGFYKKHIDYITKRAETADRRRRFLKEESARHYIDVDRYGLHPFDSLPVFWDEAVKKFGEDSLRAHGIVPWHINKMVYQLTEAFRNRDTLKILNLSADLGHYVADAHVPLHTTSNYNGQLTGQHGIHGFWESRLPELFGDRYDYLTGPARYIEQPQKEIWRVVKESYAAVDSVLSFEAKLNREFPSDQKYAWERKGKKSKKVYSRAYSDAYHVMLGGMVERRLRASITLTGNLWYTAWVNAGQPDLSELGKKTFTAQVEETEGKDSVDVPGHEE